MTKRLWDGKNSLASRNVDRCAPQSFWLRPSPHHNAKQLNKFNKFISKLINKQLNKVERGGR